MSDDWMVEGCTEEGRALLDRGDYEGARRIFASLLETATDLRTEAGAAEGLAEALWELDAGPQLRAVRERAYRAYRSLDDPVGAGRIAAWLALDALHFRGEVAVATGWLSRAARLLDGSHGTAEHGLVALFEGMIALRVDRNVAAALAAADRALAIAETLASVDLEIQALALRGLALVTGGRVTEGMRLLDEASAVAVGGELESISSAWVPCCYLMWGCEQVRDWDRAAQWCDRVVEFCRRQDWSGSPYALCRSHHGAILLWTGDWEAADQELCRAAEALAAERPWFGADALVRLGELRRRQGRLTEAGELFARTARLPGARVGMAELRLQAGAAAEAAEMCARVLDALPADALLDRAAALEVGVRAGVVSGRSADWRWAAEELCAIAAAVGTDALTGSASWARGLLESSEGKRQPALRILDQAVCAYERAAGPYEAARVRVDVALILRADGREESAAVELGHALEVFGKLGAPADADRVRSLLALPREGEGASVSGSLTDRQREIVTLLASGLTNREIAERLVVSEHTVKRHVANILTRLGSPSRAAAVAHASRAGLL